MKHYTLVLLMGLLAKAASANLIVYPTRILLSDKQRVLNVTLRHVGETQQTYKISLRFFRVTRDGILEPVTKPTTEERSALGLVRFTPKQTLLQPNLEQVVRVMAVPKSGLTDGEYRAHINFTPVNEEKDAEEDARDLAAKKDGSLTAQLKLKVEVSVPVVYRKGNPTFEASLTEGKLSKHDDKSMEVSLDLISKGTAFPYGDFVARFTPDGGGAGKDIGELKGIAGYAPVQKVMIPLTNQAGPLEKGTLKIEFRTRETKDSTIPPKLIAATKIKIN